MGKKVAIVGSGFSGFISAKSCLEHGLTPIVFEKYSEIGGLWCYKPDSEIASVMKGTIINTSKEMSSFSDFPPPPETPNFMHNSVMMGYFKAYIDHFKVLPHINFNTEVLTISRADDYDKTGEWIVKYRTVGKAIVDSSDTVEEMRVQAVMACTGHHTIPYIPDFPGQERFKGKILHSVTYKTPLDYVDLEVGVVGLGNSGGDIAVELGRNGIAKRVYLVTRRGSWVSKRIGPGGLPADLKNANRLRDWMIKNVPWYVNYKSESYLNSLFDHELYGLKPNNKPLQQYGFTQDDMANRISSGTVIIKPNIQRITEDGILFTDGTHVTVDVIILCTGYKIGFPYLEPDVIPVTNNHINLFKFMYQPQLTHPETFSIIGYIQPSGATLPMAELQSRIFCDVLTGGSQLPSKDEMMADIETRRDVMSKRFVRSKRHTIIVDWVDFMDELAEMMGVKPEAKDYLISDPKLAWHLCFRPMASYAYRIKGPHKWTKARDTLITIMDRVQAPTLKGRNLEAKGILDDPIKLAQIVLLVMVLLYYLWL